MRVSTSKSHLYYQMFSIVVDIAAVHVCRQKRKIKTPMRTFTYRVAFVVQAKIYTVIIYYTHYRNSAEKNCKFIKVPIPT